MPVPAFIPKSLSLIDKSVEIRFDLLLICNEGLSNFKREIPITGPASPKTFKRFHTPRLLYRLWILKVNDKAKIPDLDPLKSSY